MGRGKTAPWVSVGAGATAATAAVGALIGGLGLGRSVVVGFAAGVVSGVAILLAARRVARASGEMAEEARALQQAKSLLDNLLEHFPGNIYFKDHNSRFIRISRSLARHFGLESEAGAWGKTDHDMFSGEHALQAMRDEQEIMRTGEPLVDIEEKETFTDGRVGWVSTSKLPLRDPSGAIVGTFGLSLDVTERKLSQEALKESEAFFDSLVNSLPQHIFCKDPNGRFTFGNRAFCAYRGLSLQELIGKTDQDIYVPADAAKYRQEDLRVMSSGEPMMVIEEKSGANGERTFVHVVKTPRYDADRRIVGVQGIFWDVTDEKAMEKSLAQERDLLHALMDNIPDCIFFKDRDGRYTRVNVAQARLLGIESPEALVGHGSITAEEETVMSRHVPVIGHEEQVEAADGTHRWMLTSRVPIRNQEGATAGLVGIARDITQRKQAEKALDEGLDAFLAFSSAVASGDLTKTALEGPDTLGRIGRSVNTMIRDFAAMLVQVRDAALSVASSANEILAASRQIAQGAQRQTDEVNNTSSAVEEMAASMSQVSRNAQASADAAQRAQANVERGQAAVSETVSAMGQIDEASRRTVERMRILEQRSREVSEVIDLINDVAAQTQLLALNAAIEAAHAGGAGLGFNVVAEEIRKLADRTARATKEVGAIIEAIQAETAEALSATDQGVAVVEQGRALAEQARHALEQIQGAVAQAARTGQDISLASQDQAQVTRELARTMQTIANITFESSTGAQESAHTVQDLVDLSNALTEALARFKVPSVR